MIGAGIVVLAMWAWFGYRGQVVMAKKIEPESVKVRLLDESGNRKSESGKSAPIFEVATVERSDKEWVSGCVRAGRWCGVRITRMNSRRSIRGLERQRRTDGFD